MKFLRENVGRKQPVGGNSDDARDHEGVPEPLNNLHESVVVGEIQGEGGVLPLERNAARWVRKTLETCGYYESF